jgi:oxygen-dependent protoporphyrinogen oxidase
MTRDVVIVGGGIAGLSAAWRLRHRDVLLLEAGDRLGGRMRSDVRGEYWLNYGAHLFPAPGSLVDLMARECGLDTVPVTGGMMGLAVGSTLLERGRVETYPFRLPLAVRDRIAFLKAGVKVQRAVAKYHRLERRYDFEDDRTFAELLGPLPPAVHEIFSCAAHRASAELDELSAGCAIGLFALVWGGNGSLIARNLLGGTGQLSAALGRELGGRARTGCRVHAVHLDGADLVVRYGGEAIRARQAIVAAQAPYAAPLVAPVAEQAAAALAQLTYGAFLSLALETRETTAMPYDDVYAIATPGRVFDMFTNQAHALRGGGGPRRPGGEPDAVHGSPGGGGADARERRRDRRALPGRSA